MIKSCLAWSRRSGFLSVSKSDSTYCLLFTLVSLALIASTAVADPLPGRDRLKFQQLPLDNLTYPVGDPINGYVDRTYWGHDNFSTAYGQHTSDGNTIYIGQFMADDFADAFNSPVVHVKWWGSYLNDSAPIDKFLISFEEDIPADPTDPASFSRPGTPLLNQIVTRGPLFPGSGTFTEQFVSPGGAPLFEPLFEYNAELRLGMEFPQVAHEVYWLKIVALVDLPPGFDPELPPPDAPRWGWHNRDYTKENLLASTPPDVDPGEHLAGFLTPTPGVRVYHFQDNAVSGDLVIDPVGQTRPDGTIMPSVLQDPLSMQPTYYLDDIDGAPYPNSIPPSTMGMRDFSQDLAFELYTIIPEPTSAILLVLGGLLSGSWLNRRFGT